MAFDICTLQVCLTVIYSVLPITREISTRLSDTLNINACYVCFVAADHFTAVIKVTDVCPCVVCHFWPVS